MITVFVTWWILCGIAASGVSTMLMLQKNKVQWKINTVLGIVFGSIVNVLFGPCALVGAVMMLKDVK